MADKKEQTLDCLLVCPLFVFPDGFYVKQRTLDPPLGLMALAAYVRSCNHSVELFDLNYYEAATNEQIEKVFVEKYAERFKHIKVIGFTTTTTTIYAAFRAAEIFKKYFPDTVMIFGGAHASFVPDESLNKPFVDAVCIGEGEDTLVEVIEGRPFHSIEGLAYKKHIPGGLEFIKNKARSRIKKLDELPMPAYDLLDIKAYRPILGNFKRLPAMMMITSRGCPWPCNFCRRPVGRMWTYRSAKSLYNEMKYLSETYGVKDIAFMDDVFTVNEERVFELCDMLIANPLDIKWKCFARVDIVTPEMLKRMEQAGCWGIMYGVENFNQSVLDGMAKGVEVKQIYDAVRWSKEANLDVRVCMMVGNVGDTREIINRNIDLLIDLDPDYIALAILTPFPGHEIYNWAIERDLISTYNWDDYYGSTPILKLDTLTPEEITYLFRKMAFRFYFRPGFIFKKLLKMRSLEELKLNVSGFMGLASFMFEKAAGAFRSKNQEERIPQPIHGTGPMQIDKEEIIRLTRTATKQTAIT